MTLPPLRPGQFALSLEFSHAPVQIMPERYTSDLEARKDAKDLFQIDCGIQSIALIGVKANGHVGILDCFSFGAWDSDLFDLAAYEERERGAQPPGSTAAREHSRDDQ